MNGARHLRFSFFAVFALMMVVALASCSKKDVRSDEPGFSPTDGMSADSDFGAGEDLGAGDAGMAASEMETVYYAFDSFSLGNEGRRALKANAEWMAQNPSATIQIEGHCDERGTTEYNLALGERRANAAKDYMERLGVDASRMSIISYGEERPAEMGSDEAAWARNRRAAFVILSR